MHQLFKVVPVKKFTNGDIFLQVYRAKSVEDTAGDELLGNIYDPYETATNDFAPQYRQPGQAQATDEELDSMWMLVESWQNMEDPMQPFTFEVNI